MTAPRLPQPWAVWFDGSVPVTTWTQQGSTWVHSGWTAQFDHSASFTTGHISAGVSIGGTQNGSAVMMVHRLSRTHTRFSLRVSHLHVFNAQGTVADVPIINIFNPGGAITLKNELQKVFNSVVVGSSVFVCGSKLLMSFEFTTTSTRLPSAVD